MRNLPEITVVSARPGGSRPRPSISAPPPAVQSTASSSQIPRWWPTFWSSMAISLLILAAASALIGSAASEGVIARIARLDSAAFNDIVPGIMGIVLICGGLLYTARSVWSRQSWPILASSLAMMTVALLTTIALMEWTNLVGIISGLAHSYTSDDDAFLIAQGGIVVASGLLLAVVRRLWSSRWWYLLWSSLAVALCAMILVLYRDKWAFLTRIIGLNTSSYLPVSDTLLAGFVVATIIAGTFLALVRILWLRRSWAVFLSSFGIAVFTLLIAYLLFEAIDVDRIITQIVSPYLPVLYSSWIVWGFVIITIGILLALVRVIRSQL